MCVIRLCCRDIRSYARTIMLTFAYIDVPPSFSYVFKMMPVDRTFIVCGTMIYPTLAREFKDFRVRKICFSNAGTHGHAYQFNQLG